MRESRQITPPSRSSRLPGWEHRLAAAITTARARPFAWGSHDCATWAFELRRDLTSGQHVAVRWRGRYRTAAGAARVMRRLGWVDLEAMGRALLGDPHPTVLFAQRGDVVLGPDGFGICVGASAVGMAPAGLVTLPLSACRLAWPV